MITIEHDVYSGVPNDKWALIAAEATDFIGSLVADLTVAASAVAIPALPSVLTPESVIAAARQPGSKPHRGPAHDWLDAFAAKKRESSPRYNPGS